MNSVQIVPLFLKVHPTIYYRQCSLDRGFAFVLQKPDTYLVIAWYKELIQPCRQTTSEIPHCFKAVWYPWHVPLPSQYTEHIQKKPLLPLTLKAFWTFGREKKIGRKRNRKKQEWFSHYLLTYMAHAADTF